MNLTRVTGDEQEAQGLSGRDSREGADQGLPSASFPLYFVAPRRTKVRIRFHVQAPFPPAVQDLLSPVTLSKSAVFPHKGLCSAS